MNSRREQLVIDYNNNKIVNLEVFLDNVWDPHNIAAGSRICDALGVNIVHLYTTYNKYTNPAKVGAKSSSSANKWLKYNRVEDLKSFVEQKKQIGYRFIGTTLAKNSYRLDKFTFPEKIILILGNEKQGISPEIAEICDNTIYIPMVGMVESFNISVAASICLYEVFKQKGSALQMRSEYNFGQRG